MRARELITKEIRDGLRAYRDHRDNQSTVKWDKEADREHIFKLWENICVARDWKWSGEAVCGTFWLHFKIGDNWNTIKVHADEPDVAKYIMKDGKKLSDY
jgi:hypothetical protein